MKIIKPTPKTKPKSIRRIAVECGACCGSGEMGWLPCWLCKGRGAVLVKAWSSKEPQQPIAKRMIPNQ